MSEIMLGVLNMPEKLFWSDEPITRFQHDAIRLEAAKEIVSLREEKEQLQTKLAESEARVGRLEQAALIAIHALPGGDKKAEVRDIYDETKSQSLQHIQAEAALEMANYLYKNGYTLNTAVEAAEEHLAELRQQPRG